MVCDAASRHRELARQLVRIRPVKPDFWEDEEIASWPEGTRLFYIGLWNIADDAGYFIARPVHIAADLYRYESRARRERVVRDRLAFLVARNKVIRFDDCDCAWMPSMKGHVRVGGTPAFTVKNRHQSHGVRPPTPEGGEVRPGAAVREGKERSSEGGYGGEMTFSEKVAAAGGKKP